MGEQARPRRSAWNEPRVEQVHGTGPGTHTCEVEAAGPSFLATSPVQGPDGCGLSGPLQWINM